MELRQYRVLESANALADWHDLWSWTEKGKGSMVSMRRIRWMPKIWLLEKKLKKKKWRWTKLFQLWPKRVREWPIQSSMARTTLLEAEMVSGEWRCSGGAIWQQHPGVPEQSSWEPGVWRSTEPSNDWCRLERLRGDLRAPAAEPTWESTPCTRGRFN